MYWKMIDVRRPVSMPAISEQVCMYSKKLGLFVASIYTGNDKAERVMYYCKPDHYSLTKSEPFALRGKSLWWCSLNGGHGWTRLYASKKTTWPSADTLTLFNYEGLGYFLGKMRAETIQSGRPRYYLHAGRNVFTTTGRRIEWAPVPEIPLIARV